MATETSPRPITPSSPNKPLSPSKSPNPGLKPNPHPYAIKTTSTALLARSNSTSHNAQGHRHAYVPPTPPSHSPTGERRHGNRSGSMDNGQGHKYTKSLAGVGDIPMSPRPLPVPPSDDPNNISTTTPPRRARRAETLSAIPVASPSTLSAAVEDLPTNPKLWTPTQLSTYLATALRVRSSPGEEGVKLPERVAKDVAAFVRQSRIGGRTFLRLNEPDLEEMGINKLWRSALLNASRNLRQNVLKGRIWGFSSPGKSDNLDELDGSSEGEDSKRIPYGNMMYNSSNESLDEVEELVAADTSMDADKNNGLSNGNGRRGRVRNMVESLEKRERSLSRSGSEFSSASEEEDVVDPGERSGSVSPKKWLDGLGLSPAASRGEEKMKRVKSRPLPIPPSLSASASPSPSHSPSPSPSPSRPTQRRRLPIPPTHFDQPRRDEEEEPSMDELLSQQSWGARAWEEIDEDGVGLVTVKRVPEVEVDGIVLKAKGWKGTVGKGKGRVVTSVFAPQFDAQSEVLESEGAGAVMPGAETMEGGSRHQYQGELDELGSIPMEAVAEVAAVESNSPFAPPYEDTVQVTLPEEGVAAHVSSSEHDNDILRLTDEMANSKSLLGEFRTRLEEVEMRVGILEGLGKELEMREAVRMEREKERRKLEAEAEAEAEAQRKERNIRLASPSPARRPASLVSRIISMVYPDAPSSSVQSSNETRTPRTDADDEKMQVSDLPSYVFLVGLGVCAVVLKVLLRRIRRGQA